MYMIPDKNSIFYAYTKYSGRIIESFIERITKRIFQITQKSTADISQNVNNLLLS